MKAGMTQAAALAGGAVLTHQLYRRWPAIELQQWVFYVCGGAFACLTAALLLQHAPAEPRAAMVWRFGCWVALLEAAQVFGCGLLEFGNAVRCDLCLQAIGRDGYTALASAALAAVLTSVWGRRRHG